MPSRNLLLDTLKKTLAIMVGSDIVLFVRSKVMPSSKTSIQLLKNYWIILGEMTDQCLKYPFMSKYPSFERGDLARCGVCPVLTEV